MPKLCINAIQIVLNGDFNPAIFQPAWFASQKLISDAEAAAPDIRLHPDIATFNLPWLNLRVIQHQIVASTTKESHFPALRDLVLGTFRLLSHTPVRQMGINIEKHYQFESVEQWNTFGHTLAPKPVWSKFMKDPGLVRLTMVDKAPRADPPGTTQVTISSSLHVKPGIFFEVNNHFECESKPTSNASMMLAVLEKMYDPSISISGEIIDKLLSIV